MSNLTRLSHATRAAWLDANVKLQQPGATKALQGLCQESGSVEAALKQQQHDSGYHIS